MLNSTQYFLELLVKALKLYFPAMVANAAPVFLKSGTPIDLSAKFIDKKRILGDGKTFEGLAIGLFFGVYVGIIESMVFSEQTYFVAGFSGALGAMIGDILGSFVKRRLGLERGAPAPVLDQLDFIYGATMLLYLFNLAPTFEEFIVIQILAFTLHVLTNRIAYVLGFKHVPW